MIQPSENRKKALAWWNDKRGSEKAALTKQHVNLFASYQYLTSEQIEEIYSKTPPVINLGDYNLMSLLTDKRGEANNPDNYKY